MPDAPPTHPRAEPLPGIWRRGVYEAIARRRDMREFLPDPIAPTVLARVLMAAHLAGSVGFMQPWNFIVVEDRLTREKIRAHVEVERVRAAAAFDPERREKYLSLKLEGILDTPLNICITCDRTRFGPAVIGRHTIRTTDLYSTCCAVQNLWLAARAEGLGVGWVSILQPQRLREFLHIPQHVIPVAYLCVGYVREFPPEPTLQTVGWLPRLPLEQIVSSERFGAPPPEHLTAALREETRRYAQRPRDRRPSDHQHGLFMIYTGHGKGKTTAAMGMVMRALGRELPVAVIQFIKGKWQTGERLFAESLPHLTFLVMGRGFTWESEDLNRDKQAAVQAWEKAKAMMHSGDYFLVVLDEITYAINYGFIALDDVLDALRNRPRGVHVLATGRSAPPGLLEAADLVSEMTKLKHPFDQGLQAKVGIDY